MRDQLRQCGRIAGKFRAAIDDRARIDLDNAMKALFDYAQSRELIADDKHCREITLRRGRTATGCQFTLEAD